MVEQKEFGIQNTKTINLEIHISERELHQLDDDAIKRRRKAKSITVLDDMKERVDKFGVTKGANKVVKIQFTAKQQEGLAQQESRTKTRQESKASSPPAPQVKGPRTTPTRKSPRKYVLEKTTNKRLRELSESGVDDDAPLI